MTDPPKPDFFIVGAPRSGTTALYRSLKTHPQIFMPPVKEMHFFGSDLLSASPYRNREKYLEQFKNAQGYKRVGEASVWYLYSDKAPLEIRAFNPQARIIIMLRNPVDMIYSLHAKLLLIGDENIKDFKKALEAEEKRKQALRRPDGSLPPYPLFYRENGKLARHVKKYLDVFGPEKVHIILYQDLQSDPEGTLRKVLAFLEVDENFMPRLAPANPSRRLRSLTLHRILRNLPDWAWKLRRAILPSSVHPGRALMNLNAPEKPLPPLSPELRKALISEFRPEVEELARIIGRDLSCWLE